MLGEVKHKVHHCIQLNQERQVREAKTVFLQQSLALKMSGGWGAPATALTKTKCRHVF